MVHVFLLILIRKILNDCHLEIVHHIDLIYLVVYVHVRAKYEVSMLDYVALMAMHR